MTTRFVLPMVLMVLGGAVAAAPVSQVSVRDYGAKGDGHTADTAAFTAAMAAVADKGGTVSAPVGDCLITTPLTRPPKVELACPWTHPPARTPTRGPPRPTIGGGLPDDSSRTSGSRPGLTGGLRALDCVEATF